MTEDASDSVRAQHAFALLAERLGFADAVICSRLDELAGADRWTVRVLEGESGLTPDQVWATFRTLGRIACPACDGWVRVDRAPLGGRVPCPSCARQIKVSSRYGALVNPLGERLNDWCLINLIGSGGRGKVYRARHARGGFEVALKLLDRKLTSRPEYVKRFVREARVLYQLDHPNVVRVLDYGRAGERHYLAMEKLDGETLTQRLNRTGPLSAATLVDVAIQGFSGLAALHQMGLVHRDLKPDNLMLVEGTLKLIDFGLTKGFDASESLQMSLTRSGMAVGTPMYMAPEQCLGEKTDGRTDIYAFGLSLYAALTGRPPFMDREAASLMKRQLQTPLDPLPPNTAPVELERLIQQITAKRPADRPPTADAVIISLREIARLVGPPEGATPDREPEPPTPASSARIEAVHLTGEATPVRTEVDDALTERARKSESEERREVERASAEAEADEARAAVAQAAANLQGSPQADGGRSTKPDGISSRLVSEWPSDTTDEPEQVRRQAPVSTTDWRPLVALLLLVATALALWQILGR